MKNLIYYLVTAIALTWGNTSYGQGISSDANTLGLWRLDEASGTTITDASGRGHHGTTGGNPTVVSGRYNNARSFITDSIVVPDHADWSFGSNPFTIECWVNFSSNASHGIIVGQIGSGSDYWRLHYEISANKLEFVYPGSTTQYVWTPVTDQWYHLAVTKSDSVKIYINGIKVASGSIGSPGTVPNLSRPLIFGWGESNYYFKGSIDEIRISNIARSPAEFNLAPAAPANMTATAVSTSQINLSWTASTGGPTKYRIYRSDGIDNNYVQRDSISSPSANSYSATGLGTATTYYFKVAAVNEFGETRSAAAFDTTESAGISFTESSVGSTLFSLGSPLDLGDYDNDGDLDILVAGNNGSTIATKLYSNQNGSFTDELSSIDNLYAGGVHFGDYNNDGFLDFAIMGSTSNYDPPTSGGDPRLKIYKGNGTSAFTVDTSLSPVAMGNIVMPIRWGDYDFDGKQDLLAAGLLYRNEGGTGRTFSRVGFLPDSNRESSVAWCDYDRDGDQDFVYIAGVYVPPFVTQLWRNDGGSFTHVTALDAVFPQVGQGAVAWGDYNCDGLPDLAITGTESVNRYTKIFKNNGNDQFVDIGASFTPIWGPGLTWGDFDNDGWLDLIVFGSNASCCVTLSVYRNNRNNTFTDLGLAGISTINIGNVSAGDYDSDGRLDLVMSGQNVNTLQPIVLCHNTSAVSPNTKPSAPVVRNTIPGRDSVRISWDQVTGDETPSNGLTYNVRVGTSSGASNIVNPMANTNTGLRRVSRQGNAWHDTAVVVRHLANGTYYWSVQAIDNSFEGGLFSSEKSFSIGVAPNAPSSLTAQIVNGTQVSLSWSAGAGTVKRYRIFRGTSPNPVTQIDSVTATSKANTVSAAGIYYYRIAAVNDNGQSSFSNEVSLLVNSAPVWSDVSGKIPVTTAEDSTVNISLDPWAADPDHVDNALRFVVLSSINGAAELDTNTHTLSFTPSNNFSGIGTASVRVYDPLGGGDTTMFEFTISPRNDPVVKTATLRDTTLAEDFGAKKFIAKLSYFFSDVDNATLTFTPSVLNSAKTTATVSSDTLYATSIKDSNGVVDIRVVASDGLLSASDTLRLTISAVNDAPIRIALLQDQTINEDISSSLRLSTSFSDVETSSALLTYTASALSFSDRLSGLRAGHDTLYFTPAHDSTGFVDIRISVSDGQYSVYDTLRINITPVNDPPKLVTPLTNIVRNEDFSLSAIVLSGNFADNETLSKNLKYQAQALNFVSHLSLIQTSHDTLYIVGAADSNGFVDIEVTVKDDSLASAPPDTFRLTITAINDDPVRILSISDTTLAKDFGKKFMAYLPPNFRDIDNASLTYTTNATHVTPFISNDSLYLLSIAGDTASGISVIVTAKDAGNLAVKDTFTVNVRAISLGNFDSSSPSVSQATANSSVAIQFQTSSPIVSAKLFFKKGGEASFDSSSMSISGGVVSGIIPNTVIGSRGTSYYLRLSDGVNVV
ncbi:MAG TPA: FG-GAP-like repeat-containing protein, partial [bacterium]|nr:FG-GAP-like repeat-containing protein [bacterium]